MSRRRNVAGLLADNLPFSVPLLLALLDLFTLPQDVTWDKADGGEQDLSSLDPEEAGFQSSFSKLGASETARHDPVKEVGADEKLFASKELSRRSKEKPGMVRVIGKS